MRDQTEPTEKVRATGGAASSPDVQLPVRRGDDADSLKHHAVACRASAVIAALQGDHARAARLNAFADAEELSLAGTPPQPRPRRAA